MKTAKKIISSFLAVCLVFTLLPVSASAALDSRVEKAIAWAVAIANDNSHGYNNDPANRNGPDYDCSSFVSTAFKQGGFKVSGSLVTWTMEQAFTSVGFKAYSAGSVTLQRGDILLYPPQRNGHVELYLGNNQCVAAHCNDDGRTGDSGGHEIEVRSKDWCTFCKYKQYTRVLRYNGGPDPSLKVNSYFDCNVRIITTEGTSVNLFKSPTDSSRNDYYDRGGNLYSTYGAKLSDGSTWYRVLFQQGNNDVNLWLNAASKGVKIENIQPLSLSFSPSNLSVDVGASKTVSINFKGDGVHRIGGTIEGKGLCGASWGNTDWKKGTTSLIITGKNEGIATITVNLMNENDKVLYSKSFSVTVNNKTYTVSYNANGGSGAPSSQTKTQGKSLTLSSQQPTRSGYQFMGWATSPNSSSISYQPGGSYYSDKNVTLYAVWEKNKVESSISLSTDSITLDLGSSKTISVSFTGEGIEKLHHTIHNYSICDLSWENIDWKNGTASLTITGRKVGTTTATAYLLNEEGKSICSQDFTVTVANQSYTVFFDANSGSVSTSKMTVTNGNIYGSMPTPTRRGYTFEGWYTSRSGGSRVTSDTIVNITADQTLYAHWTNQAYTISFDANGGSGAPTSQTKEHDKSLTLSSQQPTRSGYQFMGWATSPNSSSISYQPGSTYTGNKDLTLYAVWEKDNLESSITFSPSSLTLKPGESKTVSANYKGYMSQGVSIDDDVPFIIYMEDSVLNKDWDDRDWSGTTTVTLTARAPGETAVTFYFVDEDENVYERSFSVTVIGSSYTVYFDPDGGEVQPFSMTVVSGSTYGSLPTPTRSGYTFEGWYTWPSDGQLITSGTTVNLTDDQVLYAHWKKSSNQSQTISFDDVNPGDWFAESVQWAIERGITVGTSSTRFSPHETCSVAQILTFIWRAHGSPEPTYANVFADVPSGSYYEKPAVWAREMGIVFGNRLDPLAPCTRAMAVEYLWKASNSPYAQASNQFVDVPSRYSQAVDWAVANGITNGTSETTFSPDATCTRAQIITFLYRNMA